MEMILRSLHLPSSLDSEFRRIAFERGVSKAELMRLFLQFGSAFLKDRDTQAIGLNDLKSGLDKLIKAHHQLQNQ